jgi:hypothetical protein
MIDKLKENALDMIEASNEYHAKLRAWKDFKKGFNMDQVKELAKDDKELQQVNRILTEQANSIIDLITTK